VPRELDPVREALRKGESDKALTLARAFVRSQPSSVVGHEVLAEIAVRREQWGEAEGALAEALRLDPTRLTAMVRLGGIALVVRDGPKAETRFRQALAVAPNFGPAHRGLASALALQRKLQGAIKEAEEAVQLSGGRDPDAKFILANVYYDAGRTAEADKLLADVVAVQPEAQPALLLQ